MKKLTLISAALIMGAASQAAAIPIVPDAGLDAGLAGIPAINFTDSFLESTTPSFSSLMAVSSLGETWGNGHYDGGDWWHDWEHYGDWDYGSRHKWGPGPGPVICPGDGGTPGANPVPEPATMLLFGTGLVGLAFISKKRFK